MKQFFLLGICALIFSSVTAASEGSFFEGVHYQPINPPVSTSVKDGKVEVVEMFWYGCPHCFDFEPFLERWLKNKPKNAQFLRVPATINPSWEVHARTFYTLQELGELDRLHEVFFKAYHVQRRRLQSVDSIARFIAQQGIPKEKFLKAYYSDDVESGFQRARQLSKAYQLRGVPAMVVNGRYLTSASMVGSYPNMLEVVNFLVDTEGAK